MVNPCNVIKLNPVTNTLETPTLLLKTKWFNVIGEIRNFTNWKISFVAQCIDEISFDVYKELDGVKCDIWDNIVDLTIVDLVGYGLFEISVSYDESNEEIKSVVGQSLEVELSHLILHDFHINDEEAITLDENYEPTVFYNPDDIEHSLLYRAIKDKAPHWKIGNIPTYIAINKTDQPELSSEFQRTYTVDGTSIYDFLMGDVATESNVTFIFDTYTRTIHCYNLEDYTWTDGTHNITINAIGEDTDIFVNRENLANQITINGDKDSVKNCFRVSGGDDVITNRVRAISMTGTNYITAISPQQKADMPTELVTLLDNYEMLLEKDAPQHENIYASLCKAYDDYHYYNSKMMPNVGLKDTTAEEQAERLATLVAIDTQTKKLVFNVDVGVYSLENYNNNLFVGVTNNVEAMAQVMVDTRYDVEVVTENSQSPTYNSAKHEWTGKFKITRATDNTDTFTTDFITATINGDEETYTKQKIEKALNRADMLEVDLEVVELYVPNDDIGNTARLTNYFYGEKDASGNVIQVGYALTRLQSFSDGYNTCLSTITDVTSSKESDVASTLYEKYHAILTVVDKVLAKRKDEVAFYEKEISKWEKALADFQKSHDLRTYLGDSLYETYCMYRREDEYQNPNYISDGYEDDDTKLTEIAKELLDVANAEIKKACVLQRQISTDLNNLLIMPEFSVFHNKFALYNYIRIRSNDELFKLRLLGIEYDSNSSEKINVTFAENIESIDGTISDLQSMKNAVTSLSSGFSSVKLQAKSGSVAYNEVTAFRNEGLNAALTRVTNSVNNEVTMGGFGILCKQMLDEGVYSPIQTKIIGSGLYITDNNWQSVKACIGETTDGHFGVIADSICGHLLIGDELFVGNESGTVKIDGSGITIEKGTMNWENVDGLSQDLRKALTDAAQGIADAAQALKDAEEYANSQDNEVKKYADDKDSALSTSLTTDYQNYTQSKVSELDKTVAKYLTMGGSTSIGSNYMISPYIGGGYLNITSGSKRVILDPGNLSKTGYIFQVHGNVSAGDTGIVIGFDINGNATFRGKIYANSGEFTGDIKGGTININNKFKVDEQGDVTLPAGTKISWTDVTDTSNIATTSQIPTKVSQLTNDSKYETATSIKNTVITKDYIETLNIRAGSVAAENITGNTITGKKISGGSIGIGNNFSVDTSGNMTCKNASIDGVLNSYRYDDTKNYVIAKTMIDEASIRWFRLFNDKILGNIYLNFFEIDTDTTVTDMTQVEFNGNEYCGYMGFRFLDGSSERAGLGLYRLKRDSGEESYQASLSVQNPTTNIDNSALTLSSDNGAILWHQDDSYDKERGLKLDKNGVKLWQDTEDCGFMMNEFNDIYLKRDDNNKLYLNSLYINMYASGGVVSYAQFYTKDGSVASTSDRDVKNTISPLDKQKSSEFIYSLIPSQYKYNNGTSDRFHHGFIAQEVKKSMGNDDWGVYIDQNPDEPGNKALRYEELIGDMIATIQLQKQEIDELKKQVNKLITEQA